MKRVSPDAGCKKDLRFSGGLFFFSFCFHQLLRSHLLRSTCRNVSQKPVSRRSKILSCRFQVHQMNTSRRRIIELNIFRSISHDQYGFSVIRFCINRLMHAHIIEHLIQAAAEEVQHLVILQLFLQNFQ